jgi:dienelactone hydrolase
MRFLLVIFSSILIISCADQQQPASGYKTERVDFLSKNIYGFENMFGESLNSQIDQPSFGTLHFPDNYDPEKKYALVIASHGSANWRDHHRKYLEQMRRAGMMVFAMHAFDARNVSSTVGNQTNVTSETMIYEMAMALKAMWNDPRIDNSKIYAAGWSLGGTAALFNAWIPTQEALYPNGEGFAGYLMWYPGCLALPDLDAWDKDLMQIYIGEEDNWTPAQPCQELITKVQEEGGNASIEVYPGAFHSFDSVEPLTLNPNAYSFAACNFKLSADTKKVYDPNSQKELDFVNPDARTQAYLTCAKKGEVMAGHSPEYKNAAHEHLAILLPELL